jgi:hypothetical protein
MLNLGMFIAKTKKNIVIGIIKISELMKMQQRSNDVTTSD